MSELKLPAASGGGSISIKGPSSSGSDTDLLDTSGNLNITGNATFANDIRFTNSSWTGEVAGKIQQNSNKLYLQGGTGGWQFRSSGGSAVVEIATDLTVNSGDIVFGTAGKGICLGATSNTDANTLSDYEEGTFTPRLGGASNIGTYNITGVGQYIKIGGICHVNIHFYNKDLDNNASGGVWIDQLPFTSYNANSMVAGITTDFHTEKVDFDETQRYSFYCSGNTTKWKGLYSVSNSGWGSWSVSDFDTAAMYMELAGSYRTA